MQVLHALLAPSLQENVPHMTLSAAISGGAETNALEVLHISRSLTHAPSMQRIYVIWISNQCVRGNIRGIEQPVVAAVQLEISCASSDNHLVHSQQVHPFVSGVRDQITQSSTAASRSFGPEDGHLAERLPAQLEVGIFGIARLPRPPKCTQRGGRAWGTSVHSRHLVASLRDGVVFGRHVGSVGERSDDCLAYE